MAKPYNKDAARLVEGFIDEKIAGLFAEGGAGAQALAAAIGPAVTAAVGPAVEAAITAALVEGGAIQIAIAASVTAHEAKEAGDTFANSHVPAGE